MQAVFCNAALLSPDAGSSRRLTPIGLTSPGESVRFSAPLIDVARQAAGENIGRRPVNPKTHTDGYS
jgi:hypothetical protein